MKKKIIVSTMILTLAISMCAIAAPMGGGDGGRHGGNAGGMGGSRPSQSQNIGAPNMVGNNFNGDQKFDNMTHPEKPEGQDFNNMTSPEKPEGQDFENMTPPEKPEGQDFNNMTPPEKPEGDNMTLPDFSTMTQEELIEWIQKFFSGNQMDNANALDNVRESDGANDFNGKVVYDATRKEEPIDQRYPKREINLGDDAATEATEE